MPPFIDTAFNKVRTAVKDMADNVLIIYGEKGFEPFKRPLMVTGPVVLALYAMVYSPLNTKMSRVSTELKNMQGVAQYAGEYEEAKGKLTAYHGRLPLLKDKDEWLNYIITNTARPYGISFDSLSAQRENDMNNYLVVSREVSFSTTYHKLGRWLADIENSRIFLRVSELDLRRDERTQGNVRVTFTLSTVFAKFPGGGAQ